ncbi:MAG: IPExxxVDY family protein [Bacteroidetes bacterium]|nr:IPExxxVDY family protein [Bacteroidota bacterium]
MATKKANISAAYENDFSVIGIACHLHDYRIVHFLNKIANFNFIRFDDLKVLQKNTETTLGFPFYYFNDTENYTCFYFISNRSIDGIMFNEMKEIDYFLFSVGSSHNINLKSLIKQIKKIPNVLAITEELNFNKTEIDNLMTDIELHITEIERIEREKELIAKSKISSARTKFF